MSDEDIHLTIDDFYEVQSELWRARQNWYNLGVRLGISIAELEVIDQDSNVGRKFNQMIKSWLNKGKNCTWKSICATLRHPTVDMGALATEIASSVDLSQSYSTTNTINVGSNNTMQLESHQQQHHVHPSTHSQEENRPVEELEFKLRHILNALYEVGFAAVDWDKLGLQLNLEQPILRNIGADRRDTNTKLTGMLNEWIQRDLTASWDRLASALGQTPGYGAATVAKFRATARLPAGSNVGHTGLGASDAVPSATMRRRIVDSELDGPDAHVLRPQPRPPLHPQPSQPHLHPQFLVDTPVHEDGLNFTRIFIFVVGLLVTVLVIVGVYITLLEKFMAR